MFAPRQLPNPPLQPVRPIDQIQMAHARQRPLVLPPLARGHANEAIIWRLLELLDNVEGRAEHRPESGFEGGAVGEVANSRKIWSVRVEVGVHVFHGELGEGAGFEAEVLEDFVELRDVGCWDRVSSCWWDKISWSDGEWSKGFIRRSGMGYV